MNTCLITPTRLVLALAATGSAVVAPAVAAPGPSGAPDFSLITERYGAAVVNISVSGVKQVANEIDDAPAVQRRGLPGLDPNDPFSEFFRRFQVPDSGIPGQGARIRPQDRCGRESG